VKRCEALSCDVAFTPQRSTAQYCSATCRQRAARARKAAADGAKQEKKTGTNAEHSLVKAVRLDLEKADAFDTVAGQLALQIARRIADPESTGISTLSKELRALLAEAKGEQSIPEGQPPEPEPEEDELEKARRQRAESREAAGLA